MDKGLQPYLALHQDSIRRINTKAISLSMYIFFRQSKMLGITKIAEEIKKNSSKWIKQFPDVSSDFRWQNGYGSFSVSGSGVDNVARYIRNQEEIHRKRKLKREMETMMKTNKLTEYNEKFFWD